MITNQVQALQALKPYISKGIHVEIRGSWIWITGEVDQVKADLVKLGYKYHQNKHALYWHKGGYHKKSKQEVPLDKIRVLFEGQTIC